MTTPPPLEILAVILGIANIALLIRRSIWNYAAGIPMVIAYAVLFYSTKLYSDALLQGFFLAAQVYGWMQWRRAPRDTSSVDAPAPASKGATPVAVRTLTPRERLIVVGLVIAATAIWGTIMHRFTNAAAPYWDGGIAMASIAAQLLLAWRFLENWWLWIAVDIAAIPLFLSRGLTLTAALYGVFLVMAILGARAWHRAWASKVSNGSVPSA